MAKSLDREKVAKHKMIITATDNGLPPLSATASLIISVMDANDNDPVFSKSAYEFQVEENKKAGAFVGKIAAIDADLGDNAVVRYSLFPSNTSFVVNPVSGEYYPYLLLILLMHIYVSIKNTESLVITIIFLKYIAMNYITLHVYDTIQFNLSQ